jgi:hypothetical protein
VAYHPLGPFDAQRAVGLAEGLQEEEGLLDAQADPSPLGRGNSARIKGFVLGHLQPAPPPASLSPRSSSSSLSGTKRRLHSGGEAPSSSSLESSSATDALPMIDTESLLSRLPYRKMLGDMFGGCLRGNLRNLTIPYVTRAYEEAFMREPSHSNERECANGAQCECMFIDRGQSFICVEFLLPGETPPRTPHLCVLCCRAVTQQLYYDVVFDRTDFPGTIQRFGNLHGQPGEYALDAMLIAAPSAPVHIMPLPIVSHQRNRYAVHVAGGLKRLRQSRVFFQSTPSCLADSGA